MAVLAHKPINVMAGLVPAIHALAVKQDVDARHKAGHDGVGLAARATPQPSAAGSP